jgi:sulfur carrier protein
MNVTINGTSYELPEGATVDEAVQALTTATTGVAVALNEEVVAKGAWASTVLSERDSVEVLTAVQGG